MDPFQNPKEKHCCPSYRGDQHPPCGLVYGYRTRHLYFLSGSFIRCYKTRLIVCGCRTVGFDRFRRLRVKNLHNCKSKKSKIDLWGVKLQDKVPSIFVRDEIFENIRRTQRSNKGKHRASLCSSFVFYWDFRRFRPEHEYFGRYAVTLLLINRFLIFWT